MSSSHTGIGQEDVRERVQAVRAAVAQMGRSLDDAMLDMLNRLSPSDRAVMIDKIRDGWNRPLYRIVDGEAAKR